ncbi:MAG: universal stress protein [Actinobacteria bacterium]|uniref:Unannotated protein n=1 Tax=freshwater metagenome TaxID=449393 RepID=A0A6J6A000_9ZZZZ|nr:universal stress protein [Actinomycetota bacterium]
MSNAIVVGYDGSDGSKSALDEALAMAADLGCALSVVYSYDKVVVGGESHDLDDAVEAIGEGLLAEASQKAQAAGVEVSTQFLEGPSAQTLSDVADQQAARFIVVGSTGERPLKALVLGSTASKLLGLANRPVLVVRAN